MVWGKKKKIDELETQSEVIEASQKTQQQPDADSGSVNVVCWEQLNYGILVEICKLLSLQNDLIQKLIKEVNQ